MNLLLPAAVNMSSGAKHIPAEVVHEIISSFSSADLVSVGLVNHTFQSEAGRLLYRSVGYRMHTEKVLLFLDTTAAVKKKAVLVKSLFICIYRLDGTAARNSAIIERLSASLPNMTALTNLILLIFIDISEEQRISLTQAMQRSTFSLTSFYTNLNLDFGSFIPKQTSLQYLIIGDTYWIYEPSQLSLYRSLIESSPPENRLCLFSLSRFGGRMDTIISFPAFSREWSAAPIKEALPGLFQDSSDIYYFVLYIDTLSDHEHLRQCVKSISDNFPDEITNLDLYVRDNRIDKNPEELASTLSYLTGLSEFCVHFWKMNSSEVHHLYLPADDRVDLARRWSAQCPTLLEIYFPNGNGCVSNGEGTSWSLR